MTMPCKIPSSLVKIVVCHICRQVIISNNVDILEILHTVRRTIYRFNSWWRIYMYASVNYGDVKLGTIASQITNLTIVYSTIQTQIKETSKLRATGLFVRNSPVTGAFPAQMVSNAENGSIWWRHHGTSSTLVQVIVCCPHGGPNR